MRAHGGRFCLSRRAVAFLALLVVLAGAGAGSASAAEGAGSASAKRGAADGMRQRLDRVVAAARAFGAPGGVVGVTGNGVGRYERAFGLARPGRLMRLDSRFRIASITKTFTATVILELVDRHQLALNETIARWEPRIPNARRITIEMLLGMRSGIWDEGGSGPTGRESLLGKWVDAKCSLGHPTTDCGRYWKPQQLVDLAVREGAAAYPPGTAYYSDTNYMILGIIAQRVTGKSLGWLVHHLILDPLHMRHTTFPTHSRQMSGVATAGYVAWPLKAPTAYQLGRVPSPSVAFGSGNIVSTLGDLQIWASAMARGVLLKPCTQRLRLQLLPLAGSLVPLVGSGQQSQLPLSYGLGVTGAGGMLGHNGELTYPGYTSDMWYVPSAHGTVVTLFNSVTPCATGTVLSDALAATLALDAFPAATLYRVPAPGFIGVGCLALKS